MLQAAQEIYAQQSAPKGPEFGPINFNIGQQPDAGKRCHLSLVSVVLAANLEPAPGIEKPNLSIVSGSVDEVEQNENETDETIETELGDDSREKRTAQKNIGKLAVNEEREDEPSADHENKTKTRAAAARKDSNVGFIVVKMRKRHGGGIRRGGGGRLRPCGCGCKRLVRRGEMCGKGTR